MRGWLFTRMAVSTTTWWSAFGVLWVGGWGFVLYRYPAFIVRIGFRSVTPGRIRFIRLLGVVEMSLAALSIPVEALMLVFHLAH
jgi:hypothetical protein